MRSPFCAAICIHDARDAGRKSALFVGRPGGRGRARRSCSGCSPAARTAASSIRCSASTRPPDVRQGRAQLPRRGARSSSAWRRATCSCRPTPGSPRTGLTDYADSGAPLQIWRFVRRQVRRRHPPAIRRLVRADAARWLSAFNQPHSQRGRVHRRLGGRRGPARQLHAGRSRRSTAEAAKGKPAQRARACPHNTQNGVRRRAGDSCCASSATRSTPRRRSPAARPIRLRRRLRWRDGVRLPARRSAGPGPAAAEPALRLASRLRGAARPASPPGSGLGWRSRRTRARRARRWSASSAIGHVLARSWSAAACGDPERAGRVPARRRALMIPAAFAGIDRALAVIRHHVEPASRIVVHGDYDVDGVCATAIMIRALRDARRRRPLVSAQPARGRLRPVRGDRRAPGRARDTASSSDRRLRHHRRRGGGRRPGGRASTSSSPTTTPRAPTARSRTARSCTRRSCALPVPRACAAPASPTSWPRRSARRTADEDVELVALATVADLVPLTGENRRLVREGLAALATTVKPGLRALMAVSRRRIPALWTPGRWASAWRRGSTPPAG